MYFLDSITPCIHALCTHKALTYIHILTYIGNKFFIVIEKVPKSIPLLDFMLSHRKH